MPMLDLHHLKEPQHQYHIERIIFLQYILPNLLQSVQIGKKFSVWTKKENLSSLDTINNLLENGKPIHVVEGEIVPVDSKVTYRNGKNPANAAVAQNKFGHQEISELNKLFAFPRKDNVDYDSFWDVNDLYMCMDCILPVLMTGDELGNHFSKHPTHFDTNPLLDCAEFGNLMNRE